MVSICLAFIIHFIADFLLQRREVGQKKSSSLVHLAEHIIIIFLCFLPFGAEFAICNAIVHMLIDACTWNAYKYSVVKRFPKADKSFPYWTAHWFYVTIGLDQLLHALTIIILLGVL
jgi:hypothetical protein